jgi:hypothetical protein
MQSTSTVLVNERRSWRSTAQNTEKKQMIEKITVQYQKIAVRMVDIGGIRPDGSVQVPVQAQPTSQSRDVG